METGRLMGEMVTFIRNYCRDSVILSGKALHLKLGTAELALAMMFVTSGDVCFSVSDPRAQIGCDTRIAHHSGYTLSTILAYHQLSTVSER